MAASEDTRQSAAVYLQLIVHRFETDPVLQSRVLAGVGLSPGDLEEPGAEILYTQLLRLFENMRGLFGAGWFLDFPDLWRTPHGPLFVACMSAPSVDAGIDVVTRYMPAYYANLRYTPIRTPGQLALRVTTATPLSEDMSR